MDDNMMQEIFEDLGLSDMDDFNRLVEEIYLANKDEMDEMLHNDPKYQDTVLKLEDKLQELGRRLGEDKKEIFEEFLDELDERSEVRKFESYKKGFTMSMIMICLEEYNRRQRENDE